jgi:hypothetical protein
MEVAMRRAALLLAFGTLLAAWPAAAQRTPEQLQALYESHKGDFDYLLGDWEFTATNRQHGESRGYWSAVRLPNGQVLDEFRIVSPEGETWYVTTTLRAYNAAADRWELVGMDEWNGLQDMGTARRVGDEVHIEQRFDVISPEPSLWRIRYYDIRPDRFSWRADRSPDDGRTWVEDHMRIEARRIGPPRSMEPIAPARNRPTSAGNP